MSETLVGDEILGATGNEKEALGYESEGWMRAIDADGELIDTPVVGAAQMMRTAAGAPATAPVVQAPASPPPAVVSPPAPAPISWYKREAFAGIPVWQAAVGGGVGALGLGLLVTGLVKHFRKR